MIFKRKRKPKKREKPITRLKLTLATIWLLVSFTGILILALPNSAICFVIEYEVFANSYLGEVEWSPDGSRLSFVAAFENRAVLFIMDTAGKVLFQYAENDSYGSILVEGWSPDSSHLIFSEGAYLSHIFVVNADGENLRKLTTEPRGIGWLKWSPDGQHFAFAEPPLYDRYQLVVLALDGQEIWRSENLYTGDFDYAWSPDGNFLAFSGSPYRDSVGWEGLYVADLKTGETQEIGHDNRIWVQQWSDDGKEIIIARPQIEYFAVNVANGTRRPLDDYEHWYKSTTTYQDFFTETQSPDGTHSALIVCGESWDSEMDSFDCQELNSRTFELRLVDNVTGHDVARFDRDALARLMGYTPGILWSFFRPAVAIITIVLAALTWPWWFARRERLLRTSLKWWVLLYLFLAGGAQSFLWWAVERIRTIGGG